MSRNGDKRPWLAAVFAVVYPGLGHVYLRLWGRAVVWSALAGLTAATFLPSDLLTVGRTDGVVAALATVSTTTLFMLASVTAMAAVDAYWHAARGAASGRGDDAPTCPECGREVDEDLSFCQWCTAELE